MCNALSVHATSFAMENPNRALEHTELVAAILGCNVSYTVSDYRLSPRRVDDEALIQLTTIIRSIGKDHQSLLGASLDITLVSSMSYYFDNCDEGGSDTSFQITLKKGHCSTLLYLPKTVFWGLLPQLTQGGLNVALLTYGPVRYGSADLISLSLMAAPVLSDEM